MMEKNIAVTIKRERSIDNVSTDSEGTEQETEANSTASGLLDDRFSVDDHSQINLFESIPIVLSESRLLNDLSIGESAQISKRTKRLVHKAVKETLSSIQPRGVYRIMPFRNGEGGLMTDDGIRFSSKYLSRILKNCDRAVAFLVTIGEEIDERIGKVMQRSPHYGYLLDFVASSAAEEAARVLQRQVRAGLPDDFTVTYRYSPGYCDWPLCEQAQLLKTIPHRNIGVELSDSCLMSPNKSVSGVFGICSKDSGIASINHCTKCSKKKCPHRRR